jgi:CRP-like cAMP-binding protein
MWDNSVIDKNVRKAIARTFLSTLSPSQMANLFQGAQLVKVEAGTVIYREYDVARIAILVSGLSRAYRVYPNGKQMTVLYNHPGDILGILRFSKIPWHMNAETVVDSTFLALSTESFIDFFRNDAEACWSLFLHLSQRHGTVINELPYHSQGPADRRVARYLLEIASPCQEDQSLSAVVTHQDIADAVALTRESVTRTLRQFRKSGLLKSGHRREMLLDPKGLHLVASSEERIIL